MPRPTNKYDRQHLLHLQQLQRQIDAIYKEATREAAAIGMIVQNFNPDKPFTFDDYPLTRERVERLMMSFKAAVEVCVVNGVESEWTLANNKNNELANRVFGKNVGRLTQEQYRRYYSTNEAARDAFLQRKERGLSLSDRVWRYTGAFKDEIEMGLDLGLRGGLSADQMTHDLRQYLQHPDTLFRRVRDEHGILHLSKHAATFHPGRGVYRSSYMNARRLAATEGNIAYRTSDHTRWQQMDFVVGIEIHLSNNHTCKGRDGKPHPFHDICDELKGRYPKDFKFTGWHPHCRCYATTILKTPDELKEDTQKILDGEPTDTNSVNEVKDVPQGFKDWMKENQERIEQAQTLPYFLRDNEGYMNSVLRPDSSRLTKEQKKAVEKLSFEDNDRIKIDKISKPYDEKIRKDYKLAMTFDEYTSGSEEINSVARFGKLIHESFNSNNVEDWKYAIKSIDQAINKLPRLSEEVDMFRASTTLGELSIRGKSVDEMNKLIGQKFEDKGFTSFSFSKKVAEGSSKSDDFIIILKAKKGTKGVSLANTSSFNDYERQEEFLMARNTEYRILGAKEVNGKKYLFVDAEQKSLSEIAHKGHNAQLDHKPTKHGEQFLPIPMKPAKLDENQILNRNQTARLCGFSEDEITKMRPMNYDDADSGNVNAQVGKNVDTRNNCQGCVVTFEARCRGIDVTAAGYDNEEFRLLLEKDQTLAWRNSKGEHPRLTAVFDSEDSAMTFLTGSEMAKNGRYQLGVNKWNGEKDGHILNLIRVDGVSYIYDGQLKYRCELSDILSDADWSSGVELLRVDKLMFDKRCFQLFKRR